MYRRYKEECIFWFWIKNVYLSGMKYENYYNKYEYKEEIYIFCC